MTGQCLQSQQQTRERSHVSHYQGKVTAYPMTHRFHWPVTTIRHHQPGIIMFNRFYLGPASNCQPEWMDFSNYFCLNTRGEVPSLVSCDYLVSLCFHSGSATFPPFRHVTFLCVCMFVHDVHACAFFGSCFPVAVVTCCKKENSQGYRNVCMCVHINIWCVCVCA